MTFPKARLVISLLLFLGWLGFLGFLVYERHAIVLSRPQFAVAQAFVAVRVNDERGEAQAKVTVEEILWCADDADRRLLEKGLSLPELMSCGQAQGYRGAGVYVIPLIRRKTYFEIAPVATPGFPRTHSHGRLVLKNAGAHPEWVLGYLIRYARQNSEVAEGLLAPLTVPIVECIFARVLLPNIEPMFLLPPTELPRRLPLADAYRLSKELKILGASVDVHADELRIYPWTAETRAEVTAMVRAKTE